MRRKETFKFVLLKKHLGKEREGGGKGKGRGRRRERGSEGRRESLRSA